MKPEGVPNGPRHPSRESAEKYRDLLRNQRDSDPMSPETRVTIEEICRRIGGGIQ